MHAGLAALLGVCGSNDASWLASKLVTLVRRQASPDPVALGMSQCVTQTLLPNGARTAHGLRLLLPGAPRWAALAVDGIEKLGDVACASGRGLPMLAAFFGMLLLPLLVRFAAPVT